MMVKHMSSCCQARANFADLLGLVFYTNEAVIVEKKGKPVAVIVSPQEYAALKQAREQAWETLDALRAANADADPDEVLADVTAEVEAVRHMQHGD